MADNIHSPSKSRKRESGHTGVNWHGPAYKWRATLGRKCLGYHERLEDAVAARRAAEEAKAQKQDRRARLLADEDRRNKALVEDIPGVYWHSASRRWQASLGKVNLGYYDKMIDAIEARERAEEKKYCVSPEEKRRRSIENSHKRKAAKPHEGVSWDSHRRVFAAKVPNGKRMKTVGYFNSVLEAVEARKEALS